MSQDETLDLLAKMGLPAKVGVSITGEYTAIVVPAVVLYFDTDGRYRGWCPKEEVQIHAPTQDENPTNKPS